MCRAERELEEMIPRIEKRINRGKSISSAIKESLLPRHIIVDSLCRLVDEIDNGMCVDEVREEIRLSLLYFKLGEFYKHENE